MNFDLAFKFSIFFFFCFVLFSFANLPPPPTRSFTQTFNEIFPIHSLSLSIQHRNNHPFYTPHLALPRQCTCLFVACRECEFRLLINLCFHMAILVVVFVCVFLWVSADHCCSRLFLLHRRYWQKRCLTTRQKAQKSWLSERATSSWFLNRSRAAGPGGGSARCMADRGSPPLIAFDSFRPPRPLARTPVVAPVKTRSTCRLVPRWLGPRMMRTEFIAPRQQWARDEERGRDQGSYAELRAGGHARTLALAPGPDLTGISGWWGVHAHPL